MKFKYHLDQTDLQEYVKNTFGSSYLVTMVSKMNGGAQKVVYKVDCSNGFSCVLYVWDLTKNFFQEEIENAELHEKSYGADLFEANNKYLTKQGIETPTLYNLNKERNRYPYDYGLVEYVDGYKSEVYFQHTDKVVKDKVFQRIGEMLARMHGNRSDTFGKVNHTENSLEKCHHLQMKNAKMDVLYASQFLENFKLSHNKILDTLYELEAKMESRSRYSFIHGELGPDHVLINNRLEPYLIDIEGAEFFDLEHEHSFLQFRFGDYYRYLQNETLDPSRMLFYRFHHHISLTAGGLKLLHRGFPNQQFAKALAEYHCRSVMRFVDEI